MADLLGHELLIRQALAVPLVGVLVGVSLCDEAVALGEPLERAFGGGPVHDEVVEARLQLRERAIILAVEVLLAASRVEAGFPAISHRQLRVGGDEAGNGLLGTDSLGTVLLPFNIGAVTRW